MLDSNLLLLLLVGAYDRNMIVRFKRTQQFVSDDFDLLVRFVEFFERVFVTPHILTEVSNMSGQLREPARREVRMQIQRLSEHAHEQSKPSAALVVHSRFLVFGLTDVAVISAASECLVLTDDFDLAGVLAGEGADVINFNHIRTLNWH